MTKVLDWHPGQPIGMMFTAVPTPEKEEPLVITQAHIDTFFDDVKSAAAKAGLHLDMWGLKANFEMALHKDYGKRKWYEGAQAFQNGAVALALKYGPVPDKELNHLPIPEFQP